MEPLTSRTHTLEGGSGQFAGGRFLCRFSRQDWIAALGCGLVALVVYLLTLAPTVTAEDSGELIAAAYTLGIPHAPGYPLFVLLAKGFVTVFPFGEVAWRVNLFTAMMGGLSVALLVLLCRRLSAGLAASISLSLAAAFSSIFWSQAIMAEVYTLSTAAFLLVLHLLVLFFLDPTATRLWILAYAFGLSLTAHPSMILLAPGLLLGVGLRDRRIFRRPGQLLIGMLFFALGFSVFLYLPLRSLADPVMDWGNPETVSGFFGHLLRRQYAGLSDTPGQSLLNYPLYLGHLAFYEVGPVFVILSLLGAQAVLGFPGEGDWPFERKSVRRAFGITSAFLVVSYSAGLLFFISVSFQKATLALNSVFFIPLLFLLAVPSALGLDRLAARLAARLPERMRLLPRKQAGWAAAAAIPLAFLLANYRGNDKSDYRIARDYAENILRTLPKDSIYMPGGDHANFPVIYLQVVEGKRPDVTVADRYGYLDPAFLKRLGLDEGELKRVRSMPRSEADRFVIDRVGKPVLVNSKRSILELSTERFLPFGLLYRVDRERRPLLKEEEDKLWDSYTFSNLGKDLSWKRGTRDIPADYILVEVLFHQASRLFQRGDADGALKALESLREVASGYKEALQNAGSLLVEEGCGCS